MGMIRVCELWYLVALQFITQLVSHSSIKVQFLQIGCIPYLDSLQSYNEKKAQMEHNIKKYV